MSQLAGRERTCERQMDDKLSSFITLNLYLHFIMSLKKVEMSQYNKNYENKNYDKNEKSISKKH